MTQKTKKGGILRLKFTYFASKNKEEMPRIQFTISRAENLNVSGNIFCRLVIPGLMNIETKIQVWFLKTT